MALLHIPLNQIEEQHILELIAARAPETNIIEYKRETYGNALRDDLEFLADVSSLANTSGGDLIIGIAATQGVPDEPVPFTGDFDAEINRLESEPAPDFNRASP
jgi:predicted HTH transcriptional regulator